MNEATTTAHDGLRLNGVFRGTYFKLPPAPIVRIAGEDGRELLAVYPDGTVAGSAEDASEAGRLFVKYLREQYNITTNGARP